MMNDDQKHQDAEDTDEKTGEESISGSTADLESDDNVLDAAHNAGLYSKADEEHPEELGLDNQINQAEKDQWED